MSAILLPPRGLLLPPREIQLPNLKPMLSVIGRAMGFMGGAPANYATWNPADFSSNFTLSGGNLVVTTNTNGSMLGRATVGKSSGKWYWEIKSLLAVSYTWMGIATAAPATNSLLGSDANGVAYYGATGQYYKAGGYNAYGATYTNPNVIGVALDMSALTVTFYKDNASQGAISIAAGTWYPAWGLASDGVGSGCTANFGASAFTYSPPAGHNAGLY